MRPVAHARDVALESLSEALITTDADGRVDYINPAAARLLGVVAEETAGTHARGSRAGGR